jgi:uncharacterized protein (TIGR01777 family)
MRVIITGGAGLIGRATAESLSKGGHEVILLSRSPERVTGLSEGIRAEHWDGRSASGWGFLADGAEAIVNLAGENLFSGRWTPEQKRRIRESRIHAGEAVVGAVEMARQKPRVVIQASGVGYYGSQGDEPVTEEGPPGEDFLGQVAVKWEGCTLPVETFGVRRAIIRSAPVLSTAGGVLPRIVKPFGYFVGGPLGGGKQWFPWIHMVDEVGAIRFLIKNQDATGPFNLAAPNPVTNEDFAEILGRVIGRPSRLRMPAFTLRILFGEMATVLLEGQRATPRRLQDLGFSFRFSDVESALRDLLV